MSFAQPFVSATPRAENSSGAGEPSLAVRVPAAPDGVKDWGSPNVGTGRSPMGTGRDGGESRCRGGSGRLAFVSSAEHTGEDKTHVDTGTQTRHASVGIHSQ